MKNYLLILCISFSVNLFGQNIFVNFDIDTSIYKVEKPLTLWTNFLKTNDDKKGSQYWNKEEVELYGDTSYFLIETELQFGTDNLLSFMKYANFKILSIRKTNEFFKITTLMEFPSQDEKSNIYYIFHVYAGYDTNGKMKLFNPLEINTDLYFNTSTIGYIKFHYPKYHEFNTELAQKQNDFLVNIALNFSVPIDTIDYYFAPTSEEVYKIRGFDFIIGNNGEQIPSGRADSKNRIVYSAGLNEYYPHEFIHILLNSHYPNCHLWFNEGVATYFGMSRGKELDWHLKRLNEHLISHPEIDLNNMLELKTLDQYTDYRYVLGGFFIKKAFEKGDYNLLKEIMNEGKTENDFYNSIEKHFVKKEKLNEWIRKELQADYNNDNKK